MTESMNTREIVLNILLEITKDGQPSHQVLTAWLLKYQYLDKQDRSFISRLVRTTLENQLWIDAVLNHYSSVKVNKMKPVIRTIMRMSVCQLVFMDGIPDHAVCNEAVNLAVRKGFRGLKGFVNGVLRTVARNKKSLETILPDKDKQPMDYLSLKYSMPRWIVELWSKCYGVEMTEQMLEATSGDRPTSIRVNTLKTTVAALKKKLEADGVQVEESQYLPYVLKISGYDYLNALDSFNQGEFIVQDESSAIAGAAAGFKAGDSVIDICAAPGGKSLNAAMLMEGKGQIESRDVTEFKIEKIRENIMRTGIDMIEPNVMDALILDETSIEKADVVIADVPCSGLGVIGRKTDIKYNMTEESMHALEVLQKDILETVWRYVKPGGVLMYSTCTINPGENILQVQKFIENHPFVMEGISDSLPEILRSETTDAGWLQLLPGVHSCDGFFMAKLRRKE